jgi:hypothetical protein
MPNLSDLMKMFKQSQFGQALSGAGFGTPDMSTPADALTSSMFKGAPADLEERIEAATPPPAALQAAMATPLHQLLNVPAGRVDVDRTGEFRALTGQDQPGQGLADWLTEAASDLFNPGNISQAMVPMGVNPFKGGPEAAIRSARNPKEAFEARIRQVGKRKPGVGAPKNPRIELTKQDGTAVIIGSDAAADSMLRIKQNLPSDEAIWEAALWHDKMAQGIADHFDVENAGGYKIAFGLTQAANSPQKGIGDVLITERKVAGHPEPRSAASTPATALEISEVLSGRPPTSGIGQKISAFIDNAFGKKTRTEMNDDPRFGAPVSGDRWDFRSQYVDYAYKQWLTKTFGEQVEGIKLDTPNNPQYSGRVSPPQFEHLVRTRNAQVEEFNRTKFAGHDDWTPDRIQAADWAAIKIQQGDPPMAVPDIFASYFSQSPMELAWGSNSPYSKFYPDLHELPWEKNVAITTHVLTKLATAIGEQLGVRVLASEPVSGTYKTYVNPNIEFTLFGTEKARQEWTQAMAHAANQEAVLAYHLRAANKGSVGVYDLTAESPLAAAKLQDRAFLVKYLEALQAKDPRFDGVEVLAVDGKPTLRIVKVNKEYGVPIDEAGNPVGHFTPAEIASLDAAADAAAKGMGNGFETRSAVRGADIQSSFNDWEANPNGEAHTSNFNAEGRTGITDWLEGPLREETGKWIEEGFRKHAPDTWDAHFATKPKSSAGTGGVGDVAGKPTTAGSARLKDPGPYKRETLGTPSSVATFSRGWILTDGSVVQVPVGVTHEASLAAASGAPIDAIAKSYAAYAAKGKLIKFTGEMGENGYGLTAEIFRDPTAAQVKTLKALRDHNERNVRMYDQFQFVLKDPLTNQVVGKGTDPNKIQGTVRAANFDIPF